MMFQISAGKSLAVDLGTDYSYTMDKWSSVTQHKISSYPDSIFRNITKSKLTNGLVYIEPSFSFSKLAPKNNIILDGYFQSEKYFSHNRNIIKSLFFVKENKSYKDYTFIHVRRKDYLLYPEFHPTCCVSYYSEAIKTFPNEKFIVLSDDIEWCKKNIKAKNIEYNDSATDLEDLSIMVSCKNAIIANSTFSWWGAWLSNSNQVIAPKFWFGPRGPSDWKDIYPDNWKIL